MDVNTTFRKKDKGWQYIISYKVNGKWKQKAKQGFLLKSDAKEAADKRLLEIKKELKDTILDATYETITFKELGNVFMEHSKLYKEFNSIEKIKNTIKKFNRLQDKKVKDIKKMHVQSCIDDCIKEGLKYRTITTYLTQLKLILNYYKDNYDSSYIVPDKLKLPKKTAVEKKALTKEELLNLLEKLKQKNDVLYIVSLLAGTTGLRIGEIEGLTWSDIQGNELNVDKQWKRLKDGSVGFGSLKNNKKRMVPIPEKTLKELKSYHKTHPTDLTNRIIITNKFYLINTLNRTLKELAGVSVHELRHTYATLLVASNTMDFKTIARILGHNVEQTLKTYSHVNDSMYKNAQEQIAKIF